MPLTLTYALLGVSFAYILFGNCRVNAESDKQQLGKDRKLPGLTEKPPETISVLPTRRKLPMRQSYPFPIVSKGGVLYYDLAGINDTSLDILSNSQKVRGITASHGNCKIHSLYLGTHYHLDEELVTNCANLSLRLEGDRWRCLQDGLMLLWRGVKVNMTKALCMDVWLDGPFLDKPKVKALKFSMEEGIKKLKHFNIDNCSAKRCICKWYFKEDSYYVNVDCDSVGLTDDMLPNLPDKVQDLWLRNNELHSMDTVIKILLPHHLTLQNVRLDDNFMKELPHFPKDTFPKIVHLSMDRNKIEEIDIEVFKELITRKELIISLQGNTFPCDCNLYNFKVFLQKNYLRHWGSCKAYMNMKCKYKDQDKKVKMHTLSEELCKTWLDGWQSQNWWWVINLTLGAFNVVLIVLMIDLICILKRVGCKSERVPLMSRLMCLFGLSHHKPLTNEDAENLEMTRTRRRDSLGYKFTCK